MTAELLILISTILLIAYLFDLTSSKTKIPSVILLLFLGWTLKLIVSFLVQDIPDLNPLLPLLGTIGLIMIVLEGTMDLEINSQNLPLLKKGFSIAFLSFLLLLVLFSSILVFWLGVDLRLALINSVPFCIVSSSIAISSVRNWEKSLKTIVIYESTLSDIIGIMVFNFLLLNNNFQASTFLHFGYELVLVVVLSILASLLIVVILGKLRHHVKYGPILLMIILLYSFAKLYHLPGLIFIVVFGLLLGNIQEFQWFKRFEMLKSEHFVREIEPFKDIVNEATFLLRSLFFILFGFLIKTEELFDLESLKTALIIVGAIVFLRFVVIKTLKIRVFPLLFISPRGLITILLFYSIPQYFQLANIKNALVLQVIVISVLIMVLSEFFKSKEWPQRLMNRQDF